MKSCLIVDDSTVIRKVARQILESLDFEIAEAENGREALDACYAHMPDVILADWNMPLMGGLGFLRMLRSHVGGEAPKVVVCTTEHNPDDIVRAMQAGANECVMKPFDRAILADKFAAVGVL